MISKTFLVFFTLLIIISGIFIVIKSKTATSSTQESAPTSTSAPTPTSVVTLQQMQISPNPANTITLKTDGFFPQQLTVTAGATVTWINSSGTEATVNSDPHPVHTDYPPLNLGQFNDGESLQLRFSKPGKYGYHNHFDATQTGTIIVQ